MGATDLNVRVNNRTLGTRRVMVYQKDPVLNVKTYYIGAWAVQDIGSEGGYWDFVLPSSIQVQARMDVKVGSTGSRILEADYNTQWEIFSDKGALNIKKGSGQPGDNTIDIKNTLTNGSRVAVVLKDAQPLFARVLPPSQKVNFSVTQKVYFALAENHQKGALYEAVTLTDAYEVDFEGHQNLDVTVHEDDNGLVYFTHKFVGEERNFLPMNRTLPASAAPRARTA